MWFEISGIIWKPLQTGSQKLRIVRLVAFYLRICINIIICMKINWKSALSTSRAKTKKKKLIVLKIENPASLSTLRKGDMVFKWRVRTLYFSYFFLDSRQSTFFKKWLIIRLCLANELIKHSYLSGFEFFSLISNLGVGLRKSTVL